MKGSPVATPSSAEVEVHHAGPDLVRVEVDHHEHDVRAVVGALGVAEQVVAVDVVEPQRGVRLQRGVGAADAR